jgi:hypothetical protein
MEEEGEDLFVMLPGEVWECVCAFLSEHELVVLSQLSHSWRHATLARLRHYKGTTSADLYEDT